MAQFKIETRKDSPVIIHQNNPKFEAWLGGEDGDWINCVEWIDEVPEIEKDSWKDKANQWYESKMMEK
ncbi:hypothetical protein [Gracilimonas sp.]|uniref:hypothetical protein n=1 Tax=Gracilimonas sp. TaxID=1974203 RepID=UPI0032F09BF2